MPVNALQLAHGVTLDVRYDKLVNGNNVTLALFALAHIAGDETLGPRFLALSGMDAAELRARAGDPDVLAAVVAFLAANEADLIECAAAIGVTPEALAAVATALNPQFDGTE